MGRINIQRRWLDEDVWDPFCFISGTNIREAQRSLIRQPIRGWNGCWQRWNMHWISPQAEISLRVSSFSFIWFFFSPFFRSVLHFTGEIFQTAALADTWETSERDSSFHGSTSSTICYHRALINVDDVLRGNFNVLLHVIVGSVLTAGPSGPKSDKICLIVLPSFWPLEAQRYWW